MDSRQLPPLVSVVTLNFNGKRFLQGLFESLERCTYPNLEIIMVDNCSDDQSVAFVREHFPAVKVVINEQNLMYAGGNNQGLKVAAGEFVCLINNDVDVDAGFIEPLVEAMREHPEIAAVQPKILAMQQRDYLEYAGACGGFVDFLGYPFLRGRLFFTTEKDSGQYDDPAELFWASGACLFLRKSALEEAGFLDEDFVMHMEEIDLCWRLRLLGWKIMAIPHARVWHHVGGTLDKDNPRKTYWNFRNNIFLLLKNLSAGNLWLRLPLRIPLDALAFTLELLKGHFANGLAIAKAYGWLVSHTGLMFRKRRENQRYRKLPDKAVLRKMYPGSVVFEYFILRRKAFSKLLLRKHLLQPEDINRSPIVVPPKNRRQRINPIL